MKQLLMISAIFLTFQAQAEIFKCKNDNGKITYQGTPCLTGTVGKVNKAPDVPIEEQTRAQSRLNNMKEMDRQHEAATKLEQQQEENARKQEAKELENRRVEALERQATAAERQAAATEHLKDNPNEERSWKNQMRKSNEKP